MSSKKVQLPTATLNRVVAKAAKRQNTKNKLQAGELREMVTAILSAVTELTLKEKVLLIKQLL
jgi:hypothetical protein